MGKYKLGKTDVALLTKVNGLNVVVRNCGEGWYIDCINRLPQSHIIYHKTADEAIRVLKETIG